MSRGRWRASVEKMAVEAFLVLIKREKASKTYSRAKLTRFLAIPEVKIDFIKLCFEYDDSDSLAYVRKGLFLSIKAIGPSKFTRKLGINRVSLYRMLGKNGNPSVRYLVRIAGALGIRLWGMEEEVLLNRNELQRPKNIFKDSELFEDWMNAHWGPSREYKSKKNVLQDEWDESQEEWSTE
jgi:DNA-binding phage protein